MIVGDLFRFFLIFFGGGVDIYAEEYEVCKHITQDFVGEGDMETGDSLMDHIILFQFFLLMKK